MDEQIVKRYEELLSDKNGAATMVRTRGQDILLEWQDANEENHVLRGWCIEGQLDVNWQPESREGWPENLR